MAGAVCVSEGKSVLVGVEKGVSEGKGSAVMIGVGVGIGTSPTSTVGVSVGVAIGSPVCWIADDGLERDTGKRLLKTKTKATMEFMVALVSNMGTPGIWLAYG
jgi:hypothetical protein